MDEDLQVPAPDRSFMADALCSQVDYDLFFPDAGGSSRAAKSICQACEVRDECLEYALSIWPVKGIWAGYTDRELTRLHGERNTLSA